MVEFQDNFHSPIHSDAGDRFTLLGGKDREEFRRRIAQHRDRTGVDHRVGSQILPAGQTDQGLRTAPLDALHGGAEADPVAHLVKERVKQPHVWLTHRVIFLPRLPVRLVSGKPTHPETIQGRSMLHPEPRIEVMPGAARHVPCHEALFNGPGRPGKVAHLGDEVERLAKVLSGPRLC